MEFSSNGAPLFGGFITYLQKNAWYIVIMLAAWFYVKTNHLDPYIRGRQFPPEPQRVIRHDAAMRRARLQQQELAQQRAIEAEKERKAKAEKEKKRKNQAALPSHHDDGSRLGRPSENSFNPLEPWTQSRGGGYKPTRRTVQRG